jgi:hypothetical protein
MAVGAEDDLLVLGICWRIVSALDEVTMMSDSAFTSVEQLM